MLCECECVSVVLQQAGRQLTPQAAHEGPPDPPFQLRPSVRPGLPAQQTVVKAQVPDYDMLHTMSLHSQAQHSMLSATLLDAEQQSLA